MQGRTNKAITRGDTEAQKIKGKLEDDKMV